MLGEVIIYKYQVVMWDGCQTSPRVCRATRGLGDRYLTVVIINFSNQVCNGRSLKAYLAKPFSNATQTQVAGTNEELQHLMNTCNLLNLIT